MRGKNWSKRMSEAKKAKKRAQTKKLSEEAPPFVQIAAASSLEEKYGYTVLYGLDKEGRVWMLANPEAGSLGWERVVTHIE